MSDGMKTVPGSIAPQPSHRDPEVCWACGVLRPDLCVFCLECGVILPPKDLSAFERLGVDRDYILDLKVLDDRYFTLQRRIHPDRFVTKTPLEQLHAAANGAAVNDAYTVLKDPLKRMYHFLELEGFGPDLNSDQALRSGPMLEGILTLQERLSDAPSEATILALTSEVDHLIDEGFKDLSAAYDRRQLKGCVILYQWLRYLTKFHHDCGEKRRRLKTHI